MNRTLQGALAALALLLSTAGFAWLVQDSFSGWHSDDDMRNLRWVIEYKDEPWLALIERHVLHGHIRPVSLWSHWLGFTLSDGQWWGAHAILAGWLALAVAGCMALTRALGGGLPALALAACSAVGAVAITGGPLTWNSWTGNTAEIAFDVWAIWAGLHFLRSGQRGWAAATFALIVGAGLSKEPGWLVPGATLFWGAVLGSEAKDRWRFAGGLVAIAVLGMLFSFTDDNAQRYSLGDTASRLGKNFLHLSGGLMSALPTTLNRQVGMSGGVLLLGLSTMLGGLPLPLRLGFVALGLAGLVAMPLVAASVIVLVMAGLAATQREWLLLMPLFGVGVMLPNTGPDATFVLSATLVLCAWTAKRISEASPTLWLAALLFAGVHTGYRLVNLPEVRGDASIVDRLGSIAGLAELTDPVMVYDNKRSGIPVDYLGAILGLPEVKGQTQGYATYWFSAAEGVYLGTQDRPWKRLVDRADTLTPGRPTTLGPGCYALGLINDGMATGHSAQFTAGCFPNLVVTLEQGMAGAFAPVILDQTCQVNVVTTSGAPRPQVVPLEDCRMRLSRVKDPRRLLDVH